MVLGDFTAQANWLKSKENLPKLRHLKAKDFCLQILLKEFLLPLCQSYMFFLQHQKNKGATKTPPKPPGLKSEVPSNFRPKRPIFGLSKASPLLPPAGDHWHGMAHYLAQGALESNSWHVSSPWVGCPNLEDGLPGMASSDRIIPIYYRHGVKGHLVPGSQKMWTGHLWH